MSTMNMVNRFGWLLALVLFVFGALGIWSGIQNLFFTRTNAVDVAFRLIAGFVLIVIGVLALRSRHRVE